MENATRLSIWQFKCLEYLALISVIGIPLWVSKGSLFGFTGIKSFLFAAIISLMLIAWVWGNVKEKITSVVITPIHFFILFFLTAFGVSATVGVYPAQSWFGTLQHGTGFLYIFLFALWGMLIGSLVRRKLSFVPSFLLAAFTTGVTVAILTFWNESGGPLGNNSYTGAYLLFCACFGIGLFWFYRLHWQRLLIGIGVLMIALSPIFLNSNVWRGGVEGVEMLVGQAQGAVMGLTLATIIIGLLMLVRSKRVVWKWSGAIMFFVLIFGVWEGGRQFMNPSSELHRYVVEHKSANRFLFWDIARAGFNERPFTGYGWGNYDMVFQEYFDPIIFTPGYDIEPANTNPHNIFWEYASTTGGIGLIIYNALFAAVFLSLFATSRDERRERRVFGIVLSGVLAGYLFQNMFVFDTPVTYLMYFSVIGIAIGMSKGRVIPIGKVFLHAFFIAAYMIGCAILVWLSVLPLYEVSRWTKSITDQTLETGKSPQYISPVGTSSDTAYIASKLYARSEARELSEAQKNFLIKKFNLFGDYLAEDAANNSKNYKTYLVKGLLQNNLIRLQGKIEKDIISSARVDLERSIALNPNTPDPYFTLAQTAVYENDFSKAYTYLRASIVLAPEYQQLYEIGEALLKISPNKNFEQYISQMKAKWIRNELVK